jgi:predicted transcriptional regulator
MAMTLRTDEQLDRVLDALAAAHGVSKQVIVTQAVMEKYEREQHSARVGAAAGRVVEEDRTILDRLARS